MADDERRALLERYADAQADANSLPRPYVRAVIGLESSWNEKARSPVGARGLMQLMPDTAERLGVNADDPIENLKGGIQLLAENSRRFRGDLGLAYAGYNSNPDLLEQRLAKGGYDGLPEETRKALVMLRKAYPELLVSRGPTAEGAIAPVGAAQAQVPAPQPANVVAPEVTGGTNVPLGGEPTIGGSVAAMTPEMIASMGGQKVGEVAGGFTGPLAPVAVPALGALGAGGGAGAVVYAQELARGKSHEEAWQAGRHAFNVNDVLGMAPAAVKYGGKAVAWVGRRVPGMPHASEAMQD